jgi:hypothetical protein
MRRKTFVELSNVDSARIEQATRLFNAARAWADANDLEEVMFRG